MEILFLTVGAVVIAVVIVRTLIPVEPITDTERLPRLAIPHQEVERGPERIPSPIPLVSPPAPVQLSKFRAEKADLPRTGPPCGFCRGVNLLWTLHGGYWIGLCKRCGTPFAKVECRGWKKGA